MNVAHHHPRLARAAGLIAGLALAASVAMPTLATSGRVDQAGIGQPVEAGDVGRARCATVWLAARADRTVEKLQAVGFCEIDRRLTAIDRLQSLVSDSAVLTDGHQTALMRILDQSETGLKALRLEIAGDTTVASVTEDVRRIFSEYRIYALVSRQVMLVRADDRVDAAAARLTGASAQLADAIAQAEGNGKDVTDAKAHLGAMNAAIAAAKGEVAGDAAAVLAQTPASWNAGTAKPILDAARASISAAHTDLRTALKEARATMAALH